MLTNQIHPTPEQLSQLQTYPKNIPVVMLNILKFKAQTESGESGQEAYARYFKNAGPFVAKSGAKLVWKGRVHTSLIGNLENQPQVIFLVEYLSVDHFLAMAGNPEYQKIATDRSLALEYGGLIACQPEI
ncbi:MAG: DUF1330 domain-containing protein [Flavobacteriaceae bacterium]|nr:DUF1330 domain-containing protein [Flavobacteriaceae bacterium]